MQARSVPLLAALVVVALHVSIAESAHGQIPIAVKELAVEKRSDSLTVNALADIGKSSTSTPSQQTVSQNCRDQFVAAKAAWAQDTTNKGPLVSFGCSFKVLQLKTAAQANEYFGDFEVGNAIALTYGDEQSTLYSELLSDNLWLSARLGYARVGLSAQIAGSPGANESTDGGQASGGSAESTEGGATVNQLFQGGGNASLHFTVPLRVWINFVGETEVDKTPVRRFDSFLTVATGVDIPELNAAVDSRSGNLRVGVQGVFTTRTFNEDFRFFVQGNSAYVLGFSDGFYNNLLGTETDVDRPRAGLGLVRGTVGVEVAKFARVGASFGTTTMRGVNQPLRLSIQLIDTK